MKRNLIAVKSTLVIGLVLISTCTVFIPTTSAGLLLNLESVVDVRWEGSETQKAIEVDESYTSLNLEIDYIVTRGYFGKRIIESYSNRIAYVKLDIVDSSYWVSASLPTDTIPMQITEETQPTGQATISLKAYEDAPANEQGFIILRVSVKSIGLIKGFDRTYTINLFSSYKPIIQCDLLDGAFYTISPFRGYEIPIEITNLGNAKTIVSFELENTTDSFDISVSDVIVDFPDGSETAILTVTADNNFNDETIILKLIPSMATNPEEKGEPILLNLFFENDGSQKEHKFPIDFNVMLAALGLIIVILLIMIFIAVAVRKKNK